MGQPFACQRSKRAKALRIFVRISCAGSIEASRAGFSLHGFNLVSCHKNQLSFGIEKAPDEPASCGAIDSNSLACDPLHADAFFLLNLHIVLQPSRQKPLFQ